MFTLHRCVLLLLVARDADALLRRAPPPLTRRAVTIGAATLAVSGGGVPGASAAGGMQRQGLGAFVNGFDRAAQARDPADVQKWLDTLDKTTVNGALTVSSSDEAVKVAIDHAGEPAGYQPKATTTSASLSTKVAVSVPGARQSADDYIKFIYLRDVDSGKVVAVRELTRLTDSVDMAASVSKGLRLAPCTYSTRHGIWQGEPFTS